MDIEQRSLYGGYYSLISLCRSQRFQSWLARVRVWWWRRRWDQARAWVSGWLIVVVRCVPGDGGSPPV